MWTTLRCICNNDWESRWRCGRCLIKSNSRARAPDVDLSGDLVALPDAIFDPATRLRETCAMRLGMDFSSLLLLGRDGMAITLDEPQVSAGEVRSKKLR